MMTCRPYTRLLLSLLTYRPYIAATLCTETCHGKEKKIFKNTEISEFFFRSCILIRLNEKKRKFYRMWFGTWNDFFPRNLVSFCFRQRLSGKIVNFLCTIKRFKAVKLRSFTKKRITFKRVIYSRVDSICSIWQLCQRRKRTSEKKNKFKPFWATRENDLHQS